MLSEPLCPIDGVPIHLPQKRGDRWHAHRLPKGTWREDTRGDWESRPLVGAAGQLVGLNTTMAGPEVGVVAPVPVVKALLHAALDS